MVQHDARAISGRLCRVVSLSYDFCLPTISGKTCRWWLHCRCREPEQRLRRALGGSLAHQRSRKRSTLNLRITGDKNTGKTPWLGNDISAYIQSCDDVILISLLGTFVLSGTFHEICDDDTVLFFFFLPRRYTYS